MVVGSLGTSPQLAAYSEANRTGEPSVAKASKILVPIDGSTCALRALRFAASRVHRSRGGIIVLLNVQPPLPPSLFVTRGVIKDYHRRHSNPIIRHASVLASKWRVKTQSLVRVGEPAPTIARLARQTHCSEIIMGTRGLGRLAGLILGSTSTKLLHVSRLPVTLIR